MAAARCIAWMARWLKRGGHGHTERPHPTGDAVAMTGKEERARYRQFYRGQSGFELADGFLERWYGKLLAFSMERRWVVGIVMLLALGSIPFVGSRVPTGFLPTDDEGRFEISIEAAQGTSLAETEIIAERLARQVRALPEVAHTVLMVGSAEGDISGRGSHEALIYVGMVDQHDRERSELEVEEFIRAEYLPGFIEREHA